MPRAGLIVRRFWGMRASVAVADPYRYVRGFQGLVDGTGQVIPDRVEVDGVLEPGRV